MKSAHRHELQTNALAQRLDVAIQRVRPHLSTLAWVLVGIAVVMVIWSYISKSSASRQGDAWNAYNQVMGSSNPNLDELQRSAEEYPGTRMQQMANITWADGQVFNASQNYILNRESAKAAMTRAESVYKGIIATSDDETLLDRAHLGLARVYEMQNDLDKAREEYQAVRGGFAEYAKRQADRLTKPEAKDTYAWLATAVAPRVRPPAGPGTPGERPEFSATELNLPEAVQPSKGPGGTVPATSIDDLLKDLGTLPAEPAKESETEPSQPVDTGPPGTPTTPTTDAVPPADTPPAAESTTVPADQSTAPPTDAAKSEEEKTGE